MSYSIHLMTEEDDTWCGERFELPNILDSRKKQVGVMTL